MPVALDKLILWCTKAAEAATTAKKHCGDARTKTIVDGLAQLVEEVRNTTSKIGMHSLTVLRNERQALMAELNEHMSKDKDGLVWLKALTQKDVKVFKKVLKAAEVHLLPNVSVVALKGKSETMLEAASHVKIREYRPDWIRIPSRVHTACPQSRRQYQCNEIETNNPLTDTNTNATKLKQNTPSPTPIRMQRN